jgi:hypothetical protein
MDLKTYLKSLPDEASREAFAARCQTTLGHMRNVMYGYKPCATDLAVRIEFESGKGVRRQDLRDDWADHWPELREVEGRPSTAPTEA